MPNQDVSNVGATSTTRRRTRSRTRRRTTGNGGITGGVRTGAGTGIGSSAGAVNLKGMNAQDAFNYGLTLGQESACKLHGIPWQGARTNR
jgi:hypothetical protein